jgi:Holliday junction resolvase
MTHTNNRARGDYFERHAKAALEAIGYVVVRSAGSLGPYDLMAIRAKSTTLLISCEVSGRIDPGERAAIIDAAEQGGARALLACRSRRGYVDLHMIRLDGRAPHALTQLPIPSRARRDHNGSGDGDG